MVKKPKVSVTQQPLSGAGGFWKQNVIREEEVTLHKVMQKLDDIEKKLDLLLGIDPSEDISNEEAEGEWVVNRG